MSLRRSIHLLVAVSFFFAAALGYGQGSAKVSNLSGAQPRGKLLTYDELAACLKEQAALKPRRATIEADRTTLASERKQFEQLADTLKAEREKIEKYQAAVAGINQRSDEQSKKIADFNERNAKLGDDSAGGPLADRERAELKRQREDIETAGKALNDDRKALMQSAQPDVEAYNTRVKARDKATDDWNARNAAANKAAQEYEADREVWAGDCAGRPYREDDEKDILKGK